MTTTPAPTIQTLALGIKRLVQADIDAGRIPPTVRSFSELHDHVDANDYISTARVELGLSAYNNEEIPTLDNPAVDIVNDWLAKGRRGRL